MTYQVDAWFERNDPHLKVIHKKTGLSVVDWRGEVLAQRLNNGDICAADFEGQPSHELVKELFLLDCLQQN